MKKQLTAEQALHRLAAYCSRAERCLYDVRQKLILWEIPADRHKEILQRLQKERFLDETRYCRAFVNDKSKYSQWGAYKIRYALKNKQIPDDLIREALSEMDPEVNKEQLLRLLQAKKKTIQEKNEFEIKQKLIRFAASRGFSLEDIEKVIDSL